MHIVIPPFLSPTLRLRLLLLAHSSCLLTLPRTWANAHGALKNYLGRFRPSSVAIARTGSHAPARVDCPPAPALTGHALTAARGSQVNLTFTLVFTLELGVNAFAHGLVTFFTDPWHARTA